jgi:MFS family permease
MKSRLLCEERFAKSAMSSTETPADRPALEGDQDPAAALDGVRKGTHGLSGRPWEPFRNRLFRALWTASLVSSLGTWMQQIANGWLMTTLAPKPLLVSLVEVANALPMFLLALPAGALADVVDRRRYLLATQCWMMLTAAIMGGLTLTGHITPSRLLIGTFVMSLGVAMNSPGWHSVTPEVVTREDLPGAVALNGLSINGAKAVGPAVAGLVLLWFGPAVAFFLNAVSFLAVISVLLVWRRRNLPVNIPPERFFSALRVGMRHVRHSAKLRTVLGRSTTFLLSSTALWALLPLLCSKDYGLGPQGYGIMVACFGFGAVSGTVVLLPRLKARFSVNGIVTGAWLVFALALMGLAKLQGDYGAALSMLVGGASWLSIMAQLHLVVQSSAPRWVQARAMSIYLLFFFGAACVGSALWGLVAERLGVRMALELASISLFVSSLSGFWAPLRSGESVNLEPSHAWPKPDVAVGPPADHGPVLVTVEYQIDPKDATAFRAAAENLRAFRYQNGAMQWGIFVDIEDPTKYREVYLEEDWGAHLRQHERVTAYETEVARHVYAFHRGPEMPPVFHFAYCDRSFPSGNERPIPREYRTTSRGVPLWFVDDLIGNDDA